MQKATALLLACFFICDCFPQQYPFVHYTPKDGLVNSRVRKAYQDSKGRMYFMTFGGLSVYDGARFTNYTTENGLLSDLVNDVLEVGDDSLLIASNTCGLNVLVRGEMKILAINSSPCHIIINHLLKSKDGKIYATADDGLYKLGEAKFEKLAASQSTDFLAELAEYKDFIVFSTNDLKDFTGLFLYNKKTDKITDALPHQTVWNIKTDQTGVLWVSTNETTLNLDTAELTMGRLVLRQPYFAAGNEPSLPTGKINFNSRNEFFLMTPQEIIRYGTGMAPLHIASPDFSGGVEAFFIDREDVLWICHDGNGVYKLPNTKLQSTDRFTGKNNSRIRLVQVVAPDSIWLVMNSRQWVLHTSSKNKTFNVPSASLFPLQHNKTHLYAADARNLYITPWPKENETFFHFKKIMTVPDTLNFGVWSVTDRFGNIILFETQNIRVFRDGKLIFSYRTPFYDLIHGLYIDKNNFLWVVSRGIGLMIFSLHPENPGHYLKKETQFIKEFETASARCMTVDRNEILWVGTRYHGLMGFEYKNHQLRKLYHFQTQNGLTDNFVVSLACDASNNVIVGMQTGLDRLVKVKDGSYRVENLTKSNNIFAFIEHVWTDVNNTAFALTKAGNVFEVEPVISSGISVEPELLIEEMKVNGKPVLLTSSPLHLKYYQRNITFSIAAPTFIDEHQVKYSYLLSGGGNNEWSDTSSIAVINLPNLSPGDYTLRVKAFFPSTTYSPKETELSFQILPPWWQTVLFRLIAVSFIIGLLVLAVRFYYSNKLRRQRAVLEKQQAIEKERTRIATDMHDDLGAGLSRIKFLSETIGIKKQKQQPIEEDITKIREYSHEMIDKMGEIVWALNEKNDSLSDLLGYTRAYAVEYLHHHGLACEVKIPENFPGIFVSGDFRRSIYLTVKEALHNIVKHAQANTVLIDIAIGNTLDIIIQDDGIGFDKNNTKPFSNGLSNMQNRINSINGTFLIKNENGTRAILSVPLEK